MRLFACICLATFCFHVPVFGQSPEFPRLPSSGMIQAAQPQVVPLSPTQFGNGGPGGMRPLLPPPPAASADAAPIASPALPHAYARQTIAIKSTLLPPRIDGDLSDTCWQSATRATGFYPIATTVPIPHGDQTEAWVTADKTHLYIAFRCLDTYPHAIRASETRRNGSLDNDDTVGIDIDSQNSRRGISTFLVSARGTQQETLEGGTADNITWAGDWKASAHRTVFGWTCEISIPFALLRYAKGAHAFGMDFFRHVARTSMYENWPYLPPAGATAEGEPAYIHEFTGISPPYYAPRPVFLPYILTTAGTGSSVRQGVDVKYPLSTTVTGVATIFPDFETIEQDVTDISFSYTEKLLTDHRPFFAEGRDYLPSSEMFYSRRIGAVDAGLKAVGKQGGTTIGFLSTASRGADAQTNAVVNLMQSFGLYSSATITALAVTHRGQPSNQAAKLQGVYGWRSGTTRYYAEAYHIPTWQGGRAMDSKDVLSFYSRPVDGKPRFNLTLTDIGPSFADSLGYVPETDLRGSTLTLKQSNHFVTGEIDGYSVGVPLSAYQHHTGGFFRNDVSPYIYVSSRHGYSATLSYDISRRNVITSNQLPVQYHDHFMGANIGWGGKTLYQLGSISDYFGRQAGERYNFLSFSQGFFISQPFDVQTYVNRQTLGHTHSTQAIVTGTYRLSPVQTVGGRIVAQDHDTDVYFSFGQQVRAGTDIFVLFGDPNSPRTRGKVSLKVVHPL